MTAYQFSCVAPLAACFFIGMIVIGYMEWKGWL